MNITVQRIRALAELQGRSLTYLCKKIGVKSRTYFQDIEKSNREIPADKLQIIAFALGTTVEYLRGDTDIVNKTERYHEFLDLISQLTQEELNQAMNEIKKIIKNRSK